MKVRRYRLLIQTRRPQTEKQKILIKVLER